ncbi:MAG: hypothetical protein J7J92_00845 [Candidatus Aenigmarchaeota archaeon]|nr:hypothetical protein [Candidatus Aenigmarchaeota archaeon]
MKYDIFLAGPWENFAPAPYKRKIKEAFKDKKIYDPEKECLNFYDDVHAVLRKDWFALNYDALSNSLSMVALVPQFPFPGVGPETGIFYSSHCKKAGEPLEELIIIWPETVKPDYGKRVVRQMGHLVKDTNEAILKLKAVLE